MAINAVFSRTGSGIKAKLASRFPARVVAGAGITIAQSGGVYTFSWNVSTLTEKLTVSEAERATTYLGIYDSDLASSRKITVDTLLTTISAGLDATLVSIAALTPTTDEGIYFSGTDTAAVYSLTSSGRALAGLVGATDKLPYFTDVGIAALADFTSFARSIVDDADAGAVLTTLGVSAFVQTLLDDADAAAVLTTLGVSAFAQTILDDADAAAVLTTLGISAFAQTLLNDADAATARATLEAAASAISLTAGAGLTGGGDLSANRTFTVGAGTGITVNADDVALDTTHARNVDHTAVTFTAGAGLSGGGDISASRSFAVGAGTGITVNADDVALANMAQSTIKGRAAGAGTGAPTDLTATEATAILDAFVGDSGAGGTKGLVPAPATGDASRFLRGDGTFAAIPGGGDLLAANNLSDVADAATAFANIKQAATTSTTGVVLSQSAAKWWVFLSESGGTYTVQASFNHTSFTDNGVGDLTFTIATDFSSANWVFGGSGSVNTTACQTLNKFAGSVQVNMRVTLTGATVDGLLNVVGYGDQ
jgi:hypothetical protein